MTFKLLTTILGIFVLLLLLLLRLLQGDVKVFVKKTTWYILGGLLTFALLGLMGFALRAPADVSAFFIACMYYLVCLGLGTLHLKLMPSVLPWANPTPTIREWLFTGVIMAVGNLAFFQVFVFFEKAGRDLDRTFADNFLWGILLFPVALLCREVWERWLTIPTLKTTGWDLPLDARPPDAHPGKSVKISILVPMRLGSNEIIQVDMLAPVERTLGDTFHYVIYRHNVEKKSFKQIEIAEGNSRQRIYQWLFYKTAKRWWWTKKQYLDPHRRIRETVFQNGEIIYAERLKTW